MTATVDIDLAALRHNLAQVRRFAPKSRVLAMIKADGYGHGLLICAKALSGADALGVARIQKARELRQAGIEAPIVLFGESITSELLNECAQLRIEPVLHTPESLQALNETPLSCPLAVWLKLDSGMHRLGLSADQFRKAYAELKGNPCIKQIRFMSHFGCADDLQASDTSDQMIRFDSACEGLSQEQSLANSAAIISRPESHRDWVRPGIMLYGDNPVAEQFDADLQPVMTLRSKVVAIRQVSQGETVGYGSTWQAERPSTIATIAVGYGDGYPRHAANGTPVLINGERYPLAGRVSMDLITVDITGSTGIEIGSDVVLWGRGLPAGEIAEWADTISYELFTRLTQRAERNYLS